MSYIALARKWRPRNFAALVGQHHITKPLINSLQQQRLHHAYLFTGTRGVGKTSIARLLAKALNCEQGIRAEPCTQCETCVAIEQGRFIDLIEIDGASRTRVEDTREILENVQYAPTSGRFKIYLIDEVHMLSQHSFNALLKTLEEPPSHVKFLLATTDPQKLPVTVLSRCLQFNLKHIPTPVINAQLCQILIEEGLQYEPAAIDLLASTARGSMRDALSLLDQAIASCDQQLQLHDIKDMLGFTHEDYAIQILQALCTLDVATMLTLSQHIANEGGQFKYVLEEMVQYLHQISVYQHASGMYEISPELKTLSHKFSPEDVHLFYQIGLKGVEELGLAPTPGIGFDMVILRMHSFRPAPLALAPILAHQTTPMRSASTTTTVIAPPELTPQALPIEDCIDTPEPSSTIAQDWNQVLSQLQLKGLALSAAENAAWFSHIDSQITLRASKNHQSLFTPAVLKRIEQALVHFYKEPIRLVIQYEDQVVSPAHQKKMTYAQNQEQTETALREDPVYQKLQQEFSAELVKSSIVPVKDGL